MLIILSHPLNSEKPNVYPYIEGYNLIKWDILDKESGRNYNDSEIRKACLAECIMEYDIQIDAFSRIYVHNNKTMHWIRTLSNGKKVKVQVAPYMFP